MSEESILSFLGVLIHYISNDGEVNRVAFPSLFFCLSNESISLIISVRKANHHYTVNNLLPLAFIQPVGSKNLIRQYVVNELLHHNIHFCFTGSGKPTFFLVLLPQLWILLFQSHLFIVIEGIESIFKEFCHDSETGSIKEEVELFVVFLGSCISCHNLGNLLDLNHSLLTFLDLLLWFINRIFILIKIKCFLIEVLFLDLFDMN